MKPRPWQNGFTLLELLLVIAVIGVIAAVGFWALGSTRNAFRLREAQTQLTQTVDRARTLSRRFGRNYLIEVRLPTTGANPKNYSYRISPRRFVRDYVNGTTSYPEVPDTDSNKPPVFEIELPKGIGFGALANNTSVRIAGPFGRLADVSTNKFCFVLLDSSTPISAGVELLGVTGKVVSRGLSNGNTSCQ